LSLVARSNRTQQNKKRLCARVKSFALDPRWLRKQKIYISRLIGFAVAMYPSFSNHNKLEQKESNSVVRASQQYVHNYADAWKQSNVA
jgi:hypothetical protein